MKVFLLALTVLVSSAAAQLLYAGVCSTPRMSGSIWDGADESRPACRLPTTAALRMPMGRCLSTRPVETGYVFCIRVVRKEANSSVWKVQC